MRPVCFLMLGLTIASAQEAKPNASATAMAAAANALLESLDQTQRAEMSKPFDDPARYDWHWIPKPTRKGITLRAMNDTQKQKALALLEASLSKDGFAKVRLIMKLEDALRIWEKNTLDVRDPLKYHFTIFGTPGETGRWGYSIEGHHLSVNMSIENNKVISSSPFFLGLNPRHVKHTLDGQPAIGTKLMKDEEELAFELWNSLTPDQQQKALVDRTINKIYNTGPPTKMPLPAKPEGLPASDMTPAQRAILLKQLTAYLSNLPAELAADRLREVEAAGVDKIHFAWFGIPTYDGNHQFIVRGPTFLLHLDNTQSDPNGTPANHIHSCWRAPRPDFGMKID